jgi:4-alpha-glucanotransferase
VVYTGTHDNDTLTGWWATLPQERRRLADAAVRPFAADELPWRFIRLAQSSPARVCIVQVQDVLGLGPSARMNHPGRERGQWRWRLEPGQLTAAHADRLHAAAAEAGRLR